MLNQEHHQMNLIATHPSGAEEWHCPTCGRRFLMQWPPKYKKLVIESGDEYAIHSGSKGEAQLGLPPLTMGEPLTDEDDLLLGIARDEHARTDFLGAVPADAAAIDHGNELTDENAQIELSEELLEPWRTYIERTQRDN
jgi:hypothetical protein